MDTPPKRITFDKSILHPMKHEIKSVYWLVKYFKFPQHSREEDQARKRKLEDSDGGNFRKISRLQ